MNSAELLAEQDEIRLGARAQLRVPGQHQAELNELMKPVAGKFLLWLGVHAAVWVGCALLIVFSDLLALHILATLVIGSQLHAFTVLQHDCGHQSAFRSPTANTWMGRALAFFIILPYTAFTECHKRHHRYLGDEHQDPDEWNYAGGVKWMFLRIAVFVPRFTYFALVRYGAQVRNAVLGELAFNLLGLAALAALFAWQGMLYEFVLIFVIPLLLLAVVINPISRGYEHYPMATFSPDDNERLDLAKNTITVPSKLIGVLWLNINYHVEHHAYPGVPFHNLQRLSKLMADKSFLRDRWLLERMFGRQPGLTEEQLVGE